MQNVTQKEKVDIIFTVISILLAYYGHANIIHESGVI